ncbi:MAG: ParB/RepB/Spo0J family partition protein [Clostridia bacterium]|nr:ParB/RepB/Spo0J family partition protein [Clostridia bacterium]
MSKRLGRGLSSLFAVYDDDKNNKKSKHFDDDNTQKNINNNTSYSNDFDNKIDEESQDFTIGYVGADVDNGAMSYDSSDTLSTANGLLEKYKPQVKTTESINDSYETQKTNLEQKLKVANEEMYPETTTKQVSVSLLQPYTDQPRKNFDPDALHELAQSIKEHGIIQPIIAVEKDGKYVIIAGERRFRAGKLAGLKTMPVIVKNYTDSEMREVALIENLQREDLNPIETATAIKQLIDIYGFTQDEVADKIGKSRPSITNTLRLLNLEPEVLTLVEKGRLQAGLARAMIVLPREDQIALAKKASDGKMTAREVEKIVQEKISPELNKKKKTESLSLELISMKEDMQQVFGTKVSIIGNNKKGRIYLDYYNQIDLDRIFDLVNILKQQQN